MNGGVSCTQFDCDVDEHVIFSRCAQMSCTRRKTRDIWSLFCLVFPVFWLFRHAVRKQPPLIKKVQWSTFENRRGDDVDVNVVLVPRCAKCCESCCMPACCFQFRFCMSRCASVGAHSTATVCARCVYQVFGVRHTQVVVSPSACQVVQHGCTLR